MIFVDEKQWPSINSIGYLADLRPITSDLQDLFHNVSGELLTCYQYQAIPGMLN